MLAGKNGKKLFPTILVFALAFTLYFSIQASFASADLTLTPNSLSACPCDPLYYQLNVYSDKDDSFAMVLNSPDYNFSSFLQPQIPVPAYSSIKTSLVLNTACDAQPGNYSFTVSALGQRSSFLASGSAIVKECKSLELSVPVQQSVCAGGSQSVLVSLRNNGLIEQQGNLAFDNLPPAFYYLHDSSFDLQPGETKNFLLSVQPPAGTPPTTFSYSVFAGSAKAVAALEIQDCTFTNPQQVRITPVAQSASLCAGSTKVIQFNVRNDGQTASFALSSSGVPGSFAIPQVVVLAHSNATVDFTIDATHLTSGSNSLSVSAIGPNSADSESVNVLLNDCPNAVFGNLELCLGESGSIPFAFKNTNPAAQQYVFTSTADIPTHVEPSSTTLDSGQAVTASLFVTGSALGVFPVFIFQNSTLLNSPRVIVKACQAPPAPTPQSPLGIAEKNFTMEAGAWQTLSFEAQAQIQNSNLSVSLPRNLFSVENVHAEGSKIVFNAKAAQPGQFVVPVAINANGLNVQKSFSFAVSPASVTVMEKSQETSAALQDGTLQNTAIFSVSNNGVSKTTLQPVLLVNGVQSQDASFNPAQLVLNPGQSQDLSVSFKAQENQSISLRLASGEKTYSLETQAVKNPASGVTGFFTATRAVGVFALVIVLAILALAFVLKKEFDSMQQGTQGASTEKPTGGKGVQTTLPKNDSGSKK